MMTRWIIFAIVAMHQLRFLETCMTMAFRLSIYKSDTVVLLFVA